MASGTVYSTTTALRWLKEVWAPKLDILAYDVATFWPLISDIGPIGNVGHIALAGNLARTTPGATSFDDLTFSANTETQVTLAAATLAVPVQLAKNVLVRMVGDGVMQMEGAVRNSIAEGIDNACLQDVSALVNNIVGDGVAPIDKAMILDAVQKLASGAKSMWEPGKMDAYCVIPATQIDDLLSISDITSAQSCGDGVSPAVTGWVVKAFGVNFYETTQCQTVGQTT